MQLYTSLRVHRRWVPFADLVYVFRYCHPHIASTHRIAAAVLSSERVSQGMQDAQTHELELTPQGAIVRARDYLDQIGAEMSVVVVR